MLYDAPDGIWDVRCLGIEVFFVWDVWDVGCSECGMFGIWDLQDMDVWYVQCLVCGVFDLLMFGMWNAQNVGYLRCEMFGMLDIWDVRCLGCGMSGMQDVWDVGYAMWDVYLVATGSCFPGRKSLFYDSKITCSAGFFYFDGKYAYLALALSIL